MTRAELLQIAKPVLFNTEMVKAILEGRKTVTRRCVKSRQPAHIGDILYVRETWGKIKNGIEDKYVYRTDGRYPTLGDGCCFMNFKWKPSLHMPKEAARIFLKVKDVRVERLQDITEEQTEAEGFKFTPPCLSKVSEDGYCDLDGPCTSKIKYCDMSAGELFGKVLWDSTVNKSDLEQYGWDANPLVWVIEFERIEPEQE